MLAAIGFTMLVAHEVADYWVQSDHQAQHKEHRAGQCLAHVGTYVLTQGVFLAVLFAYAGWWPEPTWAALSLAVTAFTHYVADRRAPLRWLAETYGKAGFVARGGLPLLDQAWHKGWLFPAALLMAYGYAGV